jgi:hypothetical protein
MNHHMADINNCLFDLPGGPAQLRKLDLAIDYDGVLELAPWPATGQLHPQAGLVMRLLRDEGHTLIINTCRSGRALGDALAALDRANIPYHYANQNTPERIAKYGSDSRKISADLYLDDRNALMSPKGIDWVDFYQQVNRLASQPE